MAIWTENGCSHPPKAECEEGTAPRFEIGYYAKILLSVPASVSIEAKTRTAQTSTLPYMNATHRAVAVILSACSIIAANAAPEKSEIRVASSRELRVAVIDTTKASPARDAMHQAFAAGLVTSLSRQCGAPVGVRAKCVGADNAAFNLGAGVYDAVLVVGTVVPDALRRTDALTLSAAPEIGKRDRKLYLLIPSGDASLQGMLAAAFTGALNDGKFLECFVALDGKLPALGGKVASAQ